MSNPNPEQAPFSGSICLKQVKIDPFKRIIQIHRKGAEAMAKVPGLFFSRKMCPALFAHG